MSSNEGETFNCRKKKGINQLFMLPFPLSCKEKDFGLRDLWKKKKKSLDANMLMLNRYILYGTHSYWTSRYLYVPGQGSGNASGPATTAHCVRLLHLKTHKQMEQRSLVASLLLLILRFRGLMTFLTFRIALWHIL